jgi:hypothetical protein
LPEPLRPVIELKLSSLFPAQLVSAAPCRIALWADIVPSRNHRPHGVRLEAVDDNFNNPHVGGAVVKGPAVVSCRVVDLARGECKTASRHARALRFLQICFCLLSQLGATGSPRTPLHISTTYPTWSVRVKPPRPCRLSRGTSNKITVDGSDGRIRRYHATFKLRDAGSIARARVASSIGYSGSRKSIYSARLRIPLW